MVVVKQEQEKDKQQRVNKEKEDKKEINVTNTNNIKIKDKDKTGKSWGNYVKIKHQSGIYTLYAHLKDGIKVKKGQKVKQGDLLGHMGNTGKAAGNHLHYEYYKGGASTKYRVDPEKYTYVYKDQTVSKNKEATKGLKYAEGTNTKR